MSKIIAVDFDGTIVRHVYPMIGSAVPHAFKYLKLMQHEGARLMLWTMRSDGRDCGVLNPLRDAIEFCRANGVEFWGHNENPEQRSWTRSNKQYAHLYIDDAALGCPLVRPEKDKPYVDWRIVGPMALEFIRNGTPS